ncbi:MAG TPA: cytochrome c oxidase subunit II [Steroidobacteraceae bacterium]|nr:cytochrome c oxidase subunit II [Steroidobacteraceae bacterium]
MSRATLLPVAASIEASRVDHLFLALTGIGAAVVGGIVIALVVFAVRYRAGNRVDRELTRRHARRIEIIWMTVPFLFFLGFFAWGAVLYVGLHRPPPDALTINGVGKQWMWKFSHPGGQRETNELHVPRDRPVRMVLASQDVIHSFYVPAFRTKQDVVPGYLTTTWFTPTVEGTHHLFCAEYCGTQHSGMIGRIVVLSPGDYAAWLDEQRPSAPLASEGRALFDELGCAQCHAYGAAQPGPPLAGLYGSRVPLTNGTRVIADDTYLYTAIMNPDAQVRAGYDPIMPSFDGRIDEADTLKLLAYLRALGHAPRSDATVEQRRP